ncbi:MAG TPA: two-component regulator propeller domain-containing protein, partial [Pyrinomonadaceae bacterium]|nr:two-component regulator propeller domain-containing protein [Pyrinomonadaceae bacterium]
MKVKKRQNLIILLVNLTVLGIFSQILKAEHLPVKIYTSADGLGSGFVDYLKRDSNGFLWICTRDGLSRFDGSQFITYKIGGKNVAPGVESIFESTTGVYWVSTTGGAYYFDSKSIPQANPFNKNRPILDAKFAGDYRGYFFEDREGNLWIGTNGLFRVEKTDENVSFNEIDLHLPEKYKRGFGINEIKQAEDGSLWLTSNYGLMRRLPDGRTILYANEKPAYTSLLLDKKGRAWLVKGKTFQVLIPETFAELSNFGQFTELSPTPTTILALKSGGQVEFPNKIGEVFQFANGKDPYLNSAANRLFQTADGVIWLTTDNGLYEFKQNKVYFYSTEQGLPPSLMRMEEDTAGNLWIGGQSGLTRLDRKGLVTFGLEDGLNSRNIFAITQDPEGNLYFANGDYHLSKFNGSSFQTVRPNLASDARRIWTSRYAFIDSHGEFWILTSRGLYRFTAVSNFLTLQGKNAVKIYGTNKGLICDEMFQIFEDSHGTIWLSMQPSSREGRGLVRFNRENESFYQFSQAEDFPEGKSASSFAEDKDGSLWLGFYEGGLAHFKDGKFTIFSFDADIPNGLITDLLFDNQGRLWISSALGGLFRIDDTNNPDQSQKVRLSTENGLSSNNVRTITEDNFGNIYAGTVRGVDRISPDTMHIKHYSVSDGLASDFVVDSFCDKNGDLWFGTTDGLSKLTPTQNEKPFAPSIRLGGLWIAGQEQNISTVGNTEFGNVELSSAQNNLQIQFFGLDFRAGETLRYQYKLEGADADWSVPTEQRTVNFANLSAGSYRFLVRAVNSEGVMSENPAVVSFKILPPIHLRWWFITVFLLLVSMIVFAFYRYRLARLREINTALAEAKKAEEELSNSRG